MYVYTVSPLKTSLVYLQKPAHLGHLISASLQILMSPDIVYTAKCLCKGNLYTKASRASFLLLFFLCCYKEH